MNRIRYITDEEAGAEAKAALESVRQRRGFVSNTHRALAHSPSALDAFERFSFHVNGESSLDARTRELAILRTALLVGNLYEWRRHVPKAIESGASVEEIRSLADWHHGDFSDADQAMLALVDGHVGKHETTPETLASVRAAYGDALLIELLLTIGWYLLVSTLILPLGIVDDDPEPADLAVAFPSPEVVRPA
jgi:alkylhydroperoxidase family enzyme